MKELRSQLEPERADAIDSVLGNQQRESFAWMRSLDEQLTRTNFLTNGGAAIAVLTFIGTGHASAAMFGSLAVFAVGVVATGVELRALLAFSAALQADAHRRRNGFMNDDLRVEQLMVPIDLGKGSRRTNQVAGWVAQLAFVVGVAYSAYVLLCLPIA